MASFVALPALLLIGALMVDGGLYGSYGGFTGYGSGTYSCGGAQCMTEIQCDDCDYPRPFVQQVSYYRSLLTRVEEYIQTFGRLAVSTNSRLFNTVVSVPEGFAEMSLKNGLLLISEISSAIENLNSFIGHHVVGRIAYDILFDLTESWSAVQKLIGWSLAATSGYHQIPIPQEIVVRYQQPKVWNGLCTGGWPCTTLVPQVMPQGAAYQYSNKYGYARQYNRGTQFVSSNYDSGNSYGLGNTVAQGIKPLIAPMSTSPYGSGLLAGYGGERALGDDDKSKKSTKRIATKTQK